MTPRHNVILRGGAADGQTLHHPDIDAAIEWEDTGGGALTYVRTAETESVDGASVLIYRLAR